jgi:hypothetical protein
MADAAYARLLDALAKTQFQNVSTEIRAAILAFYDDPQAPITTKKNDKNRQHISQELRTLQSLAGYARSD